MYADPKLVKNERLPVYINSYVSARIARIVEMTGGEKSVVGREAMERGLELLEQELHRAQSLQSSVAMRGARSALMGA